MRFGLAALTLTTLVAGCSRDPDEATFSSLVATALSMPGAALNDAPAAYAVIGELCGLPVNGAPWKVEVHRAKVEGPVKGQTARVKVEGRCRSGDDLSQRPFSGTLRATAAYVESSRWSWTRRRASVSSMWTLSALEVERAAPLAPLTSASEGRTSRAAPELGCPESIPVTGAAKVDEFLSQCDLNGTRVCWYGEIGCECATGVGPIGRWRCASAGCPQGAIVGAPCDAPLSRCLRPAGDAAAKTALECRQGWWRDVTLE